MSIENKLTYLDGTKQALKESINNLGGDITSETTFREYAQELDNIYDNLPKTTDTGTNLSLNTIKGKMNIIPKGNTSQNGTPTPDTPIDIEVVTGTQTITISNSDNTETQTQTISLGDIELCKIGNYQDYLEYDVENDKVYKNKAINKVLLKTLTWETSSVGTNSYGTASLLSYIGKVATDINIICSHATGIIFNDRNWFTNTTIYDETNGYVVFRNTSFTSLEDFTTFLNNNNVYAYYVLATATKTEITGTLKDQIKALYNLKSYNGITNINCSGNLPIVLGVSALKGE